MYVIYNLDYIIARHVCHWQNSENAIFRLGYLRGCPATPCFIPPMLGFVFKISPFGLLSYPCFVEHLEETETGGHWLSALFNQRNSSMLCIGVNKNSFWYLAALLRGSSLFSNVQMLRPNCSLGHMINIQCRRSRVQGSPFRVQMKVEFSFEISPFRNTHYPTNHQCLNFWTLPIVCGYKTK